MNAIKPFEQCGCKNRQSPGRAASTKKRRCKNICKHRIQNRKEKFANYCYKSSVAHIPFINDKPQAFFPRYQSVVDGRFLAKSDVFKDYLAKNLQRYPQRDYSLNHEQWLQQLEDANNIYGKRREKRHIRNFYEAIEKRLNELKDLYHVEAIYDANGSLIDNKQHAAVTFFIEVLLNKAATYPPNADNDRQFKQIISNLENLYHSTAADLTVTKAKTSRSFDYATDDYGKYDHLYVDKKGEHGYNEERYQVFQYLNGALINNTNNKIHDSKNDLLHWL